MSKQDRHNQPPNEPDHANPQQPGEGEPQPEQERVEQDLQAAMAAVQQERDEIEDRLRRIAADYQNYVRRAEQNVVVAREQQLMDVARSLITVMDHFDHALEVDPDKTSTRDLLQGVRIVRDELLRALQRFQIERVDVAVGEPFDPNYHEALMRQPSDSVETNHITAQFQPGYVLKDKTIRPVKVSVAE